MSQDNRDLKRITPFCIHIKVQFAPDTTLPGYRLQAKGIAELSNKRFAVYVSPHGTFTNAEALTGLRFELTVDADMIVPRINKANKE
jgi:hypothetical protein